MILTFHSLFLIFKWIVDEFQDKNQKVPQKMNFIQLLWNFNPLETHFQKL